MNKLISFLIVGGFAAWGMNEITWPEAKVTIHVVDEEAKPIANAKVELSFKKNPPLPDRQSDITVEGVTNADGMFSGSGGSDDSTGGSVSKEGFYHSYIVPYRFKTIVNNKWQPWNPTVDLILKKRIKPTPMFARKLEVEIPEIGKPIGFDLQVSDWVSPYGKGKTPDFIFTLTKSFRDRRDYEATLNLTFANNGDGIQSLKVPVDYGSALRMPRFAPETGYQESFSTRVGHPPNAAGYSDDQPDRSHFFRVQTIMKNGQIISGRYGKIQSDIGFDAMNSKTAYILFTYYFNPEINDRNMEFDPKQNLFQGFHEILSP